MELAAAGKLPPTTRPLLLFPEVTYTTPHPPQTHEDLKDIQVHILVVCVSCRCCLNMRALSEYAGPVQNMRQCPSPCYGAGDHHKWGMPAALQVGGVPGGGAGAASHPALWRGPRVPCLGQHQPSLACPPAPGQPLPQRQCSRGLQSPDLQSTIL